MNTGRRRRATHILAPPDFSVSRNRDRVLGFLYAYRSAIFIRSPIGRKYNLITIDLSDVKYMTLDAALVVTAEFHRALRSRDGPARPWIDDAGWPSDVRGLLEMLGFYELVEAEGRTALSEPLTSPLRFVKFMSEEIADPEFAERLLDTLKSVGGEAPAREAVYAGLVEAILNVTHHAYPDDDRPTVIKCVPRWWAAGAYDAEREVLEFVVYDQGVGIPATLPRKTFFQSLLTKTAPERTDADLIEGGIEFGRTSTEQPERGNGLWTICGVVKDLEGSYVRIHSGRGEVVYRDDGSTQKRRHAHPFCGTLIQWTLRLPDDQRREAA